VGISTKKSIHSPQGYPWPSLPSGTFRVPTSGTCLWFLGAFEGPPKTARSEMEEGFSNHENPHGQGEREFSLGMKPHLKGERKNSFPRPGLLSKPWVFREFIFGILQ